MKKSIFSIIETIKLSILKPKQFWKTQKETKNRFTLFLTFVLPLIILAAIAVFVGELFNRSDFFIQYPLLKASREILLFVLVYFICIFFTNELMKSFGAEKNIGIARKLIAYSLTPFLLVSIITGLFPFLYILNVLGLYSFYIFWTGATELLSFPNNNLQKYNLITIMVNFFVFGFVSLLLSKVFATLC